MRNLVVFAERFLYLCKYQTKADMKQLIFICLLAVCGCTSVAQNHQTFKGVPINGTVADFAQKLETKGFTSAGNDDDGSVAMQGTFAGYNNCNVSLLQIPGTDRIYGVKVVITIEMPLSFTDEYQKMKSMLEEKYGEPTSMTNASAIDEPAAQTDSQITDKDATVWTEIFEGLMQSLKIKTDEILKFEGPSGNIDLVGYNIAVSGVMVLTYTDKENLKSYRKSIIDDL